MGRPQAQILFLEDNSEDVKFIRRQIQEAPDFPAELHVVQDAEAALGRLRLGGIDCVLLDLALKAGRGAEALTRISEQFSAVPVIVLSLADDSERALEVIREGAQDFVLKAEIIPESFKRTVLFAVERKAFENRLARLASFAWQNHNTIIESNLEGEIIYLNPAGRHRFPDLTESGAEHPFLNGLNEVVDRLRQENRDFVIREVCLGDRFYEQHISYVPENGLIRSYIADNTERQKAERELKARTEEMERMNRVMIGREIKMIELKKKIAELEKRAA